MRSQPRWIRPPIYTFRNTRLQDYSSATVRHRPPRNPNLSERQLSLSTGNSTWRVRSALDPKKRECSLRTSCAGLWVLLTFLLLDLPCPFKVPERGLFHCHWRMSLNAPFIRGRGPRVFRLRIHNTKLPSLWQVEPRIISVFRDTTLPWVWTF